ncbi:MAG TPA: ABC transporter permease [Vicinamibacterales bacterium]|nr:ABC transporter permease [Vicinamibacterales bacterium]
MTLEPFGRRQGKDVDRELDFHLEMLARRYEQEGLDPASARRRARERLGDLDSARAECRAIVDDMETHMNRTAWWQGLGQDVAYAWRVLRRTPAFTATALVTLSLGLGATTALFSVVNAVLLKTVPYPAGDRLAVIWNSYGATGLSKAAVAAPEFADIVAQQRAFDAVAAIRPQASSLTGACGSDRGCEPERVSAYVVSPNLFDLLGVAPARGRGFTAADGVTGAPRVVLLGDALWRRRFGADPALVGRTIVIGALSRTVIGIMPPGVRFPDAPIGFLKTPADVWIPFGWEQNGADERGNQNLAVVARLRPDVSIARGQADLDAIADTFRARFPNRYAGPGRHWRIALVSAREEIAGDSRTALLVLLGAVGVVLLIVCANVANLMLARGTARRRELAVRSALGAGRGRLARQLLVEAAMLVAIGGTLGVALAVAGVRGLVAIDPGNIPLLHTAGVDGTVLAFSIAVTVATALFIGVVPALRQSRVDPQAALADGGRGAGAASVRQRLRRLLVVAEVALASVVLVASGLLVRSFLALTRVPLGYDATGVVTAQVTVPRATYTTDARIVQFDQTLKDRLLAGPGVAAASAIYPLPASGEGWSGSLFIEGQPVPDGQPEPHAAYAVALPDYFTTLQIPLIQGRDFAPTDAVGAPAVAIVDELVARRHWPGESAVGKRIGPFGEPRNGAWTTVVGVVGHVHTTGPRADSEPQVYLPALQSPQSMLFFMARTAGDPTPLPAAFRSAVRAIDPDLPVARLTPLTDLTAQTMARERFNLLLLTLFGGVALAVAAVGLYGVMAYLVAQRAREIGIRLALGGRPAAVLRAVLAEGLAMTLVGLAAGLATAFGLSRVLADLVFAIQPTDPLTYAAIALLLVVVAIAAATVPARRAMRIDPVVVLRD